MADNFGLKIGLEGEKEFKKALSEINQSFKVLGSEMKLATSQFDKNDQSVQALTARNTVLNKEIEAQKQKIETLRAALKNAAESFGENDRRTQNWQIQLNNVLPAIIPREEWLAVQELRKRHSEKGLRQSEEYPFTNMLVCPYCGKKYGSYTSATHNRELLYWYRCSSRYDHTAVEVLGMMYTPPSRLRVENPSAAMVAYREKYNHPAAARQMICSDIRIPFNHPHKVFVRAWNQLVSKKTRYQPILQRTIETTDNALTRLRAKEMIGLLDSVGRMDGFDYALMLRTLDFIEVHSEEKMTVVFQSGIRISVK